MALNKNVIQLIVGAMVFFSIIVCGFWYDKIHPASPPRIRTYVISYNNQTTDTIKAVGYRLETSSFYNVKRAQFYIGRRYSTHYIYTAIDFLSIREI